MQLYHKYFNNCFICLIVPQTLQQLLYLYSCTITFLLQILKYIYKHTPVLLSTLVSLDARPQDLQVLGRAQLYSQQSSNCKVYLNTAETVASVLCMMRLRGGEDTQWSHLGLELPPPPTQRHTGFVFCIHFRDCISICFVYFYLFLCIKSNAHTYRFVLFSSMKLYLNMIFLVLFPSHNHPFILSWTVKQLAQNTAVHWLLWYPPHQKSGIQMNFTCWAEGQQEF